MDDDDDEEPGAFTIIAGEIVQINGRMPETPDDEIPF